MQQNLNFATQETLQQPIGGLVIEGPQEQDHVLGAIGPDNFEVLQSDAQWAKFAPNPELQRNKNGDLFMCVSFSKLNIVEFLIKRLFDETVNYSDLFLGVGSGTVRGQGNSKRAVAEWMRLNGAVLESLYPFLSDMTLDDAYKPLTKEILVEGLKALDLYSFPYKWLSDNGAQTILSGLTYSPVQVDVSGSYKMNAEGIIVWDNTNSIYNHEVVIFGHEQGRCWYVFDSETFQFLKFDWWYPFGSPMIHAVKKNMKIQIFKKIGSPALAVKHCSEPSLIAFSGGSVQGEDLFKSLYGVKNFKEIPITEVKEFPFPIRHLINTNPQR